MLAANRGVEHAFHDVVSLIDCGGLTVHDEAMAIDPQRNGERVFESGQVLIEFSEQPKLIGEFA
jgi:hypothetical protein